jgi:uncharacterized protein (TIGR03435 family)
MSNWFAHELGWERRLLLGAAAIAAMIWLAAPEVQAQNQSATRLEFDAASVKPNQSGREGWEFPPVSHGRLTIINASLRMLIANAYGVQRSRVIGAPEWFNSSRYDIVATGDANATNDQVRQMLQSLLADRFKLALHRETRELPGFALTVGKNATKLRKADDQDTAATAAAPIPPGRVLLPSSDLTMVGTQQGGGVILGSRVSMADLASALAIVLERPVEDRTGLTGKFNLGELRWSGEGFKPSTTRAVNPENGEEQPQFDAPSLLTAVQEQLGLKLEATKRPGEILAIDRAEKASGN